MFAAAMSAASLSAEKKSFGTSATLSAAQRPSVAMSAGNLSVEKKSLSAVRGSLDVDRGYASQPTLLEKKFKALERQELEVKKNENELIHSNIISLQRMLQEVTKTFRDQVKSTSEDIADLRGNLGKIHGKMRALEEWGKVVDDRHSGFGGALADHGGCHGKVMEVSAKSLGVHAVEIKRLERAVSEGHACVEQKLVAVSKEANVQHGSLEAEFMKFSLDSEKHFKMGTKKHAANDAKLGLLAKLVEDRHGEHDQALVLLAGKHISLETDVVSFGKQSVDRYDGHGAELRKVSKTHAEMTKKHVQVSVDRHGSMEKQVASMATLHAERHEYHTSELKALSCSAKAGVQKRSGVVLDKHVSLETKLYQLEKQVGGVHGSVTMELEKHSRNHVENHASAERRLGDLARLLDSRHKEVVGMLQGTSASITGVVAGHFGGHMGGIDALHALLERRHDDHFSKLGKLEASRESLKVSYLSHVEMLGVRHANSTAGRLGSLEALVVQRRGNFRTRMGQLGPEKCLIPVKEEISVVIAKILKEDVDRLDTLEQHAHGRHAEFTAEIVKIETLHVEHRTTMAKHKKDLPNMLLNQLLDSLRITMAS